MPHPSPCSFFVKDFFIVLHFFVTRPPPLNSQGTFLSPQKHQPFIYQTTTPKHQHPTLFVGRFEKRWDVEHCGESAGAALRAGPLGRVSYQLVPAGRSAASRETLYGKLLHAIGEEAASELWTRLGAEDWLVRTVARYVTVVGGGGGSSSSCCCSSS